jgi:hypothetical protein
LSKPSTWFHFDADFDFDFNPPLFWGGGGGEV